jgi:hypothetical protein
MDEIIGKELKETEMTPFHKKVLEDTRALVTISRRKMSEYYPTWDKNDDIYRAILQRDKADLAAFDRKEPEKMVVPTSFAQIMTFVSFCYTLFTQRENFFELDGFTAEDDKPAKVGEALLRRDLSKNLWEAVLFQFLLDIARFGIGIVKTSWVTETQNIRKTVDVKPMVFLGATLRKARTDEVIEQGISYQGNKIINISPYRFYPDVRLPLSRFQEGEFCASEDVYTISQLKSWEKDGEVFGVDHIKPLGKEVSQDRGYRWDTGLDPGGALTQGAGVRGDGQVKKTVIVTEVQRTIIPSQYEVDGEPIGEEDYPVKYNIWLANDNRVIKCEPMNYIHNQFTYSLAPFVFDNNTLVSGSLADTIDSLQSVISWFVNSRITNVRKIISDKLIVNPSMVNMDDLKQRKPVIRLSGAAGGDIDRYIKQLQLTDVTTTHIKDVQVLHDILKMVTGITDSLLGEVRPGKRSATENRNSTTGAAARIKTLASIIFRFAIEPMGRQMLSNLRDGLDEETYVRLMGQRAVATPEFIKVTKEDLVGHYDFEVFDGTLPSERHLIAQALEELFQALLTNPQAAAAFNLDPKKILFEVLQLRGVRNPERFELTPVEQQQQLQSLAATGALNGDTNGTGGPSGGPAPQGGPGGAPPGSQGALPEPILPLLASIAGGRGAAGNPGGVPG